MECPSFIFLGINLAFVTYINPRSQKIDFRKYEKTYITIATFENRNNNIYMNRFKWKGSKDLLWQKSQNKNMRRDKK